MKAPARWDNIEHAAADAYDAYQTSLARTGPAWADLSPRQQKAWVAAVRVTLVKAYRVVAYDWITGIEDECRRNCALLGTDELKGTKPCPHES